MGFMCTVPAALYAVQWTSAYSHTVVRQMTFVYPRTSESFSLTRRNVDQVRMSVEGSEFRTLQTSSYFALGVSWQHYVSIFEPVPTGRIHEVHLRLVFPQ